MLSADQAEELRPCSSVKAGILTLVVPLLEAARGIHLNEYQGAGRPA